MLGLVTSLSIARSLSVRSGQLLLPRWPTLLITLVLSGLLVWLGPSMFGHVQLVSAFVGRLPPFSPLPLDLELILRLLPSAVAVGMLGLVTSLSIARSLSARSQQLLDANQEVRAQGLSNMIGAFFSGSLSAGSFTRSGLSYDCLLYTSPSPRDGLLSRMPSSA